MSTMNKLGSNPLRCGITSTCFSLTIGQIDGSSSLFTYPPNKTFEDFSFPDHMPAFIDEIMASPEAIARCGGNTECLFDATQTGNIDIGLNSMEFEVTNVADRDEAGWYSF